MERNEILKAYGKDFTGMTKRLLEKADIKNEIKPGMRIGIKPNLVTCTPADFGATTHPEIVAGIIEYLQENGHYEITIVEGSWVGDRTQDAFEYCGYNELSRKYNVKLIDGQKEKAETVDCSGMKLNVLKCVNDIDYLINVPVLKGHCQTKYTGALKNMKGLIPNSEKRRFHSMGLHKPIAYLNTYIKPDLIVMDHICGDPDFEEGGNPLVRNCIMLAKDAVLTDAYGAALLGYSPDEIGYISLAAKLGVGNSNTEDLHILTIEGDNTEDLPEKHKILEVNYAIEEIDSCSACYGMLVGALDRLKKEGLFDKLPEKIGIGQGFKGQSGNYGVGNCTRNFIHNIPGCPPDEEDIYEALKGFIENEK